MLTLDLEQRFASDFTTSTPTKITEAGGSVPEQMEFSSASIDNQTKIPTVTAITTTVESEIVSGSLTCGINETINECGRACEANCKNVSLV